MSSNYIRLKEVLKEKGWTGEQLAEEVGLTPKAISSIVSGANYPRFKSLVLIAEKLDVDIRDLIKSSKPNDTMEGALKDIKAIVDNVLEK